MFGTGIIEKFTKQLECPERLKGVLPITPDRTGEIKVFPLRSGSYCRKMIVDDGEKRYLVYASHYINSIRKIVFLIEMLFRNNVKVPAIMALHTGLNSMISNRGWYVVLDFVIGERANNTNQYKITESIAENIGRLHAISSTKPGYLLTKHYRREEIVRKYEYYWKNVMQHLLKFDEFEWGVPEVQFSNWISENVWIFNKLGPFYLIHGDLHGGNIIIKENDQAVLIDFDAMHYGYSGPELFRCLMANYCRRSLEHQLLFLDTYRQHVPKESWLLWENNMSAITGFGILKQMDTWLKKSQRLKEKGEIERSRMKLAESLDLWNWFQNIIATFPDGKGDWPSIMALYAQQKIERTKKHIIRKKYN